MIVREKPGLLDLLLALRGSVLPKIAPTLAFFALWSIGIVWIDRTYIPLAHVNGSALALFGVALSLFLGFRNNAAYDRWWEARKLWGGLIADVRSLPREAELFLPASENRDRLLRLSLAFLHLHRLRLRRLEVDEAAKRCLDKAGLLEDASPDTALTEMNALLASERTDGRLDGFGSRTLSARLSGMALAQAGCERIQATPLPYVYSLLVFRTSWLYCLLLPTALLGPAGWLAPLFTVIVAYTFFGLAEVTEELAHPFGLTGNGLPLDALCRVGEISMAPHLGETPLPPLTPVAFRLD